MQDFARTAVSLVQLVLLLVPLTSLVIGVLALAPERGAAELLFSQPVRARTILLGKLLGLFAALAAAQAIGFGAAGLAVHSQAGEEGLGGFLLLFVGSLALTAVFLGLAALVAAGAVGRAAPAPWRSRWSSGSSRSSLFDVAAARRRLAAPVGARLAAADRLRARQPGRRRPHRQRCSAIEGTGAFGAASLAFLRFTKGPRGSRRAGCALAGVLDRRAAAVAAYRLRRADV